MGNIPSNVIDQKRSRRKFTICGYPVLKDGAAALFTTEPKSKCDNVKMYHVYKVIETGSGQARDYAIIDYVNICTDISFIKRSDVDGIMKHFPIL